MPQTSSKLFRFLGPLQKALLPVILVSAGRQPDAEDLLSG